MELIGVKRSGKSAITHWECTRYMKNESIKREVGGCMKARNNEVGSRLTAEQEGNGKQRSIDIISRGGGRMSRRETTNSCSRNTMNQTVITSTN